MFSGREDRVGWQHTTAIMVAGELMRLAGRAPSGRSTWGLHSLSDAIASVFGRLAIGEPELRMPIFGASPVAARDWSATILFAAVLTGFSAAASAQELDRNQVFELQFRLNQLGFEAGRLDGEAGGRTRSATYRFADVHDTRADLTPAFLAQVRAAARPIEGISNEDGSIDFLVFTDQGTPLILTVERIGRLDQPMPAVTQGAPTTSEEEPVESLASAEVSDLPREDDAAFGVQVRVPTPPQGERLRVDQVVSEPERLADGTIRFTEHVTRHVVLSKENNPQRWMWRDDTLPEAEQAAAWRFTLENAGEILLTRTFRIDG